MNIVLQRVLLVWPVICLLGAAFILPLAVPEIGQFQGFVSSSLEDVPVFLFSVLGLALGAAVSFLRSRWPRQTLRYGARAFIGMGAWLVFGLVLSLFSGEGSYHERLKGSVVIGSWAMVVWALLCMAPTTLGVHSILYRSTMARGGTVLSFLFLAISGMVYAQASEVRVAHQDPFLSIIFICAILGFLEGMNWRNRYASMDYESHMSNLLLARQVGFTLVFMGIGAVVALTPFLFGDVPREYYESTTIMGKTLVGLIAITPLAVLALVRNLIDR
ncbi:MAG: hypothetical protein MUC62_09950 [Candidatus Thermoplasmatota archaeon]|nr:hypothetical protein [Candidatus Thermoplasmatota archaeon]